VLQIKSTPALYNQKHMIAYFVIIERCFRRKWYREAVIMTSTTAESVRPRVNTD